jgi:glycosyltransferase involved in cell wall biosynthesis
MPEDSLVSIVIPVYNGERFIGPTLASALAQTYHHIEVVVVDDGSTDRTAFLVETAAARDGRIRYLKTQNSGAAAARNFGISEARGKLIAPLDADDLWHPEKIARQVEVMQASSAEVGLVYCWSIGIDENDFILPAAKTNSTAQGRVTAELAERNFLANSSSPLMKRCYFDEVGGYDISLVPSGAVDLKLYLALSDVCEFAVVPEYFVGYRTWTGGMSRDVTAMVQSIDLVDRWLFEKWPELRGELRRRKAYHSSLYFSRLALDNNQLWMACYYRAQAYKARPDALLERSNFDFGITLLVRMARLAGIRRPRLTQRRPTSQRRLSFQELCATSTIGRLARQMAETPVLGTKRSAKDASTAGQTPV